MKALGKRQKHIKVADRSDYGWSTVQHYDLNPLASDSDDEKRLEKAEKEAEHAANKCLKGGNANARKRARNWSEGPTQNNRKEPPMATNSSGTGPAPLIPPRPRAVGPCYRCAAWGHLAPNYPAKEKAYPFCQSLVSKADLVNKVDVVSDSLFEVVVANDVCNDQSACIPLASKCVEGTEPASFSVKSLATICVDFLKGITGSVHSQTFDYNPDMVEVPPDDRGDSYAHLEQEASKYWELDAFDLGMQATDVQGRLRKHVSFWKDVLQAPPPILDCINHGYRLPIKFTPPPYSRDNHASAILQQQFVDNAVADLLKNRCAVQVSEKPYICSPLLVVSNSSGKLRLILNLRYLNQFLHVVSFKYEDLRIAALMFEEDEFLIKFDLKSGYHHVDIYPEHQQYLGFRWDSNGNVNYYVFTVLPFGLATACHLFTKLIRPLVRHWRGRGLKAIVYLDDGIIAVKGEQKASDESSLVKHELEEAGFVVNQEKSHWIPTKSMEWLGFNIDLANGEFSVPAHKLEALRSLLHAVAEVPTVPARRLASVVGKIMSMSLALGPVT